MRTPFLSLFMTSPFEGLQEHAELVKACARLFEKAMARHVTGQGEVFEKLRRQTDQLESRADAVKRRVRGHIPKGTLMPVDKFQLFRYLREQDQVLDSVEEALNWLSYRIDPGIPEELGEDFLELANAVVELIEALSQLVEGARKYFKSFSNQQRDQVKGMIHDLHHREHGADKIEDRIKRKALNLDTDPVTIFHMVRLAETIGAIADHAENAGDMMRAMLAR